MKIYLSILALILVGVAAHAQPPDTTRTIIGAVLDIETGEPLSGAAIRVFLPSGDSLVPTRLGAISRPDGTFSLVAPRTETAVLDVRYVSYASRQLSVAPDEDSVQILLEPTVLLNPGVQVSATRRTRSVEDACCRVESIREEVQQHAPFSPGVVDVLRRYSSCTSSRISCAIDNSSSIRLRGLEPTYIRVLVDGLPAFSGLSTFYGLSMMPSHALQIIRISEGASSGMHGNGAISGVVNLETRPPTEIPELAVSGNLSGHGIQQPSAGDLNFSYTGMAGDVGLAAFGSVNAHSMIGEPGGIERRYDRVSGILKGNIMLDDATELILTTLLGSEERGGIHHIGPVDEHREEIALRRGDITARLARTLDEASELTAAGMLSLQGIEASYGAQPLDARQRSMYLNIFYAREFGDHLLRLGGEFFSDALTDRSDAAIGYDITIPSLIGQYEVILADEWEGLASVRLDHHSSAGTIITPRGAIKYSPLASMTMRLMAGGGFKGEALFNEDHLTLHGAYRWRPNPDFRFERSFTLNYDISYSFLIGDEAGMDANFNAYYTTITGKGIPNPELLAEGILFYENSSQPVRLTGLELQMRPTLGEHWSGSLAVAAISYQIRDENGRFRQMALAPRVNIDASLMYRDDETGLVAELWGNHIGAQQLPENPYGIVESAPYTLINLRMEKTFGAMAIFAGVLNVTDVLQFDTMPLSFETRGTENGGIVWGPLEGREVFFGARYTWSGSIE